MGQVNIWSAHLYRLILIPGTSYASNEPLFWPWLLVDIELPDTNIYYIRVQARLHNGKLTELSDMIKTGSLLPGKIGVTSNIDDLFTFCITRR